MAYPRSPLDTIGGMYHFARMVDKIWLNFSGDLPDDYKERLGKGMDGYLCKFLGVKYSDVAAQVEAGKGDEEILEWCYENGTPRTDFDRLLFNKFLEKLGWRDEDNGITKRLQDYKSDDGLADRNDIETIFDLIEVNEGRKD
ncbi:MAG: DUF5069 domain-containing protein [Candidatus Nitronauta litoralis]|uniref:DUF5069 domain-containing protein n=1 Tax=Candidatus Nitronauta litoralis TaxID=2705533 RepID=A0A7T0FYE2_9BACT|nr:MAG: DUF5069 domain-containing protein [Candidatus Nitronauta litoralis]